jgi:hypothetical protein
MTDVDPQALHETALGRAVIFGLVVSTAGFVFLVCTLCWLLFTRGPL